MRLLIVEDSDSIVKMIEALVAPRGYEVRSAAAGARGLDEAVTWKPNVILADINLPGSFDGLELLNKLRAAPETKEIPVIIISAQNDDELKRKAHEAGATAFFEKPFSPLALLKEIESLHRRSGQW
jgi:CheY-like chemotaxis protein